MIRSYLEIEVTFISLSNDMVLCSLFWTDKLPGQIIRQPPPGVFATSQQSTLSVLPPGR